MQALGYRKSCVKLSYMVKGPISSILLSKPDVMVALEEEILMEDTIQPVDSRGHLRASDCESYVPLDITIGQLDVIYAN
jgi:hypothetical protein